MRQIASSTTTPTLSLSLNQLKKFIAIIFSTQQPQQLSLLTLLPSLFVVYIFTFSITMKTFQIVTLFALVAASMAFAPNQLPQGTSPIRS
jgi:hypothetical protein